jgi:hypothetical protein
MERIGIYRRRVSIFKEQTKMNRIYKSPEGERLVRERYLAFLKHWPVAHQQIRIPTSQGETFAIASCVEDAPPLLLFHGSSGKIVTWMPDVRAFPAASVSTPST